MDVSHEEEWINESWSPLEKHVMKILVFCSGLLLMLLIFFLNLQEVFNYTLWSTNFQVTIVLVVII